MNSNDDKLGEQLRREAMAERPEYSRELHEQVMRGVRSERATRNWRWPALAAAAAIVLLVLLVPRQSHHLATTADDVNGDGVVDIRDALALQQQLNRGSAGSHDVNHDGVTNAGDVDAIAHAAVRLDGGAVR